MPLIVRKKNKKRAALEDPDHYHYDSCDSCDDDPNKNVDITKSVLWVGSIFTSAVALSIPLLVFRKRLDSKIVLKLIGFDLLWFWFLEAYTFYISHSVIDLYKRNTSEGVLWWQVWAPVFIFESYFLFKKCRNLLKFRELKQLKGVLKKKK
jgi:hypothetical protein